MFSPVPRALPQTAGRRGGAARLPALALAGMLLAALAGCSYDYARGQSLEAQERWEEAAIAYRLAYVGDPNDPDYREALQRTNKVVARENFERYQAYLAGKEFQKAYARLSDAARQDPELEAVRQEERKWIRVLVAGQVRLSFESLRTNLSLADEISLIARFNTPNPGQTIEAEIDIDSGIFFVEDLLYDPPDQLLAYYTLNSIGVNLVQGASSTRQFTSTEAVRLINFRAPVLERFGGTLVFDQKGELKPILEHRQTIADPLVKPAYWFPPVNMRYTLSAESPRIYATDEAKRTDFLPRFLYFNRESRRLFVGFGHYEIMQDPISRKWGITRLPLQERDYFLALSRNVALQPYFFYHGPVIEFVERERG
jgi:tetratricopeptide (TPR) repeat protein